MLPLALPLWVVLAGAASPLSPVIILIPPESTTASVAAGHLLDELEVPARIEQTGSFDAEHLERARSAWPDAIVIMLSSEKNEAWLARPNEAAILVRTLPTPKDASPYALAIAAAELVRLAILDAQAIARNDPAAAASGALQIAMSIGIDLSGKPPLIRPVFGVDVHFLSNQLRSSAGLRLRAPGQTSSEGTGGLAVDQSRTDLSVRIAFGPELGNFYLLGVLEGGVSLARVRAVRGLDTLGTASRTPAWLSAGGEMEYVLWRGLRAALLFEVTRVLTPADFVGDDTVLFSDADWRLDSSLSLKWVLE